MADSQEKPFGPEYRFQALFEQNPTSIQLLAAGGRTIQVNKAWEALWEVPQRPGLKEFVLGSDYNVLTDPQLRANGITPYLERAFAGESVKMPAIYYNPVEMGEFGRPRWVTAVAHPLKDRDGCVQEVMLMHEDITDQVESQRMLRASEERFRSLVMATSIMVWTTTADGLAIEDSPSWRAFTGQSVEQWLNSGWLQAVHPDDREHASEIFMQSIVSKAVYETEYRLRRADGHYCWTSAKAVPVMNADGSVKEWIGANTDITQRKQQEEALRQSEARFRTITDAMPQMVWSTRADGYHEYYNQRWVDFTGMPVGSTDGEKWENVVHPEDQDATWRIWEHSLKTGEPYEVRYRLRHRSGQYRWALGRALPVRDDAGNIVRWMGTCTDIHDQKLAEDALREADRRKDEFLAMLAHELRNPLAPISAAAELMEMVQLDPEHIRRTSQIINRQVRHMTSLVDDLLDVSRVTRGLVDIERKPLDFKHIVSSAVEQVMPLVRAKGHQLTVELPADAVRVAGDQKRLVQVLTNLLNNAAKYTPANGSLHLCMTSGTEQIILRIRDNGIGITPELQSRIFELFTQAERSPDRAQGGLGIGLALVKSLVELHGGEVHCNSGGLGKGSEFIVTLPRPQHEHELPDHQHHSKPNLVARQLKILIVDDNADAAAMLSMYLKSAGHDVVVEHTSRRALERARSERLDVCVLDIGLPEIDGYELASRLKAENATAGVKLIAITGYGQEQDRRKALVAGFDHHLVKPVDTAKLASVLAGLT
ncbi:PAS domain S-box protein [Noviherbaspirillum sp. CPCC 100848]|uniref:histidine kinase n=1 Tax=Noviherbaspirillum album TaxID=3080276 RepID=A0ABU6JEK0_9BURK|nr:PAS domain S-box protein [Noviherbaspirillum sp. CPCC 100848]MEC4721705.1 PAS domain S-box protein [Noviherbaspirillum sp. CPCC 100848]